MCNAEIEAAPGGFLAQHDAIPILTSECVTLLVQYMQGRYFLSVQCTAYY